MIFFAKLLNSGYTKFSTCPANIVKYPRSTYQMACHQWIILQAVVCLKHKCFKHLRCVLYLWVCSVCLLHWDQTCTQWISLCHECDNNLIKDFLEKLSPKLSPISGQFSPMPRESSVLDRRWVACNECRMI